MEVILSKNNTVIYHNHNIKKDPLSKQYSRLFEKYSL